MYSPGALPPSAPHSPQQAALLQSSPTDVPLQVFAVPGPDGAPLLYFFNPSTQQREPLPPELVPFTLAQLQQQAMAQQAQQGGGGGTAME